MLWVGTRESPLDRYWHAHKGSVSRFGFTAAEASTRGRLAVHVWRAASSQWPLTTPSAMRLLCDCA